MPALKDLTGKKFGMLYVVRRYEENDNHNKPQWVCDCDCGNKGVIIKGSYLTQGGKWNCGCQNKHDFIDLTGKRFGHLTVLNREKDHITKGGYRKIMWRCKCDCGNEIVTRGESLVNKSTTCCGNKCKYHPRHKTHGLICADAPEINFKIYGVWQNMRRRCYDPGATYYEDYGGRGIQVCEEWRNDFKAFYDWAITHGYAENLDLDRINNEGDYTPDNCHFVIHQENCKNRRSTHWLQTPWGVITTSDFCRKMESDYGAKFNTVKKLICNDHKTVEEVLERYKVAI